MAKEQELVPFGWPTNLTNWDNNNYVIYSLNTQEWRKLYERQEGKCAGCREVLANPLERTGQVGLKPQVDHRHKANEPKVGRKCEREAVRGLLCGNCNRFLGMIQDNKSLLQNLVNYLKQHGDY